MVSMRCLRAAMQIAAFSFAFAAIVEAAVPQVGEEAAISSVHETDFEVLLRRLGEVHAAAVAATGAKPETSGDSFPELLQHVQAEHAKALSRVESLSAELAEAKARLGSATFSSAPTAGGADGAAAAVEAITTAVAGAGFRVEGEHRRFLAPAPAASVLPSESSSPLRSLQMLDPSAYGAGVSVIPLELEGDEDSTPVFNDTPDPYMPNSEVAQFGFNICRNGNRQHGGCCQQISSRCCTAHSRSNINWRWQMCFNGDTRMLRVTTAGRHTFEILAAQVATTPAAFHARWQGPNEACFPEEDFTIYQFNR
mmetsp:Transcript_56900/g.144296  ORF Transcript_56900/g.144296 Transcript_56900/m.144296 type:complete len:310 (-) Transcript_56900:102-1031(-)